MRGIDLRKGPVAKPRHLRAQAGFIDEDKQRWIEIELAVDPVLTTFREVRRSYFSTCAVFFESPAALSQPNVKRAAADRYGSVLTQPQNHLVERDILFLFDHADDEGLVSIKA